MNPGALRPATSFTVRQVRPEDAGRVTEIYAHHVLYGTATFEIDPPSAPEMARRIDDVTSRGLPWAVAEGGPGVILGYAYAGAYRLRPAYQYTVEDSVYLDPSWLGRGIGRALLAGIIVACEVAGCRQMVAVIGDSANAASIALHRSLGFRDAGVFRSVGWKFGRWLDTVMMQRELGPGAGGAPEPQAGIHLQRPTPPSCT